MTREELESVAWQILGRYTPCPRAGDVAELLNAADTYARTTGGITAIRRAVIGAAPVTRRRDQRAAPRRRQ